MYEKPPRGNVDIEEFERLALVRLEVLKFVETTISSGHDPKEVERKIKSKFNSTELSSPRRDPNDRDHVSHFALRVAYCSTEQKRTWFIKHETELFKALRTSIDTRDLSTYPQLAPRELAALKKPLRESGESRPDVRDIERWIEGPFFRVPFSLVPDLVATRKVLVSAGSALVHKGDLFDLTVLRFRAQLSKSMALMAQRWNAPDSEAKLEEDDRLVRLSEGIHLREAYDDFSKATGTALSAAEVPRAAKTHFPLCMFTMHQRLEKETARGYKVSRRARAGPRKRTGAGEGAGGRGGAGARGLGKADSSFWFHTLFAPRSTRPRSSTGCS